VGEQICQAAHERGAKVVLLPTIPYGTETNMRQLPLAMNLNPSTLNAVLTDLIQSLVGSGIRKIVVLNSHGGNESNRVTRLYGHRRVPVLVQLVQHSGRRTARFSEPEDCLGDGMSFVMAHFPELIGRHRTAHDG
jgi:creatinine amidohydrolase